MAKHFSPEYKSYITSSEWYNKSSKCKSLTKGYCVVLFFLKANHSHHMTYRNFQKELPIVDIVPLSALVHSVVHWKIFYKTPAKPIVNSLLRVLMIVWLVIGMFRKPCKK